MDSKAQIQHRLNLITLYKNKIKKQMFSFKNNKLQIIGGAIIRENNYENSEFLRDIIKNCNANQESEDKLNNYSCDLYEQGSSLMLDIRYYNPKD